MMSEKPLTDSVIPPGSDRVVDLLKYANLGEKSWEDFRDNLDVEDIVGAIKDLRSPDKYSEVMMPRSKTTYAALVKQAVGTSDVTIANQSSSDWQLPTLKLLRYLFSHDAIATGLSKCNLTPEEKNGFNSACAELGILPVC